MRCHFFRGEEREWKVGDFIYMARLRRGFRRGLNEERERRYSIYYLVHYFV